MLPTGALSRPGPSPATIMGYVISYMLFSSTRLIINKAAVKFFPLPSMLLVLQMASSAIAVWIFGQINLFKVDRLEMQKIKAYIGVVLVFTFNLFTNIKAVQGSNVETVIVFQTLTSLAVAYGDWKLLKSGPPPTKIIVSLLVIVVGAVLYMIVDSQEGFKVDAYFWQFAYFFAKFLDTIYIKHIVDTVPMTSWGRSFYNNLIAIVPVSIMAIVYSEPLKYQLHVENNDFQQPITMIMVILSCIMGLGISISGFKCRETTSATSFSVIGNMNKIGTVFINYLVWDHHTSPLGLVCLGICMFGGAYYAKVRQA